MEMVQLPKIQKLWILRKFYAGNGGALPPTDPRILDMTMEQIDLEFELIKLDKARQDGKEAFEDDEYESWDEDSEEYDKRLSDPVTEPKPRIPIAYNEDEWEPIE